jgi:hypothetical protein
MGRFVPLRELSDNSPVPDYCGIRPNLAGKGKPAADFLIGGRADHGLSAHGATTVVAGNIP